MKKRAAWFITIGVICLVLLAVCVSDISRNIVVHVDSNGWGADEPTPVSAPVTYTDENGMTRSIADDPPASEWDGPWDNNLVARSEEVWGVTPDGDSEYPWINDSKSNEDYYLYSHYVNYHLNKSGPYYGRIFGNPASKDPTAGIDAGRNIEPDPGPYATPSFGND